jgi:excisionase family DNA binding protein
MLGENDMGQIPSKILQGLLQADPERMELVAQVLEGNWSPKAVSSTSEPLLLQMKNAAKLLGTSRTTLWRLIRSGRLGKVEILPGSFRVRRSDIEKLARE